MSEIFEGFESLLYLNQNSDTSSLFEGSSIGFLTGVSFELFYRSRSLGDGRLGSEFLNFYVDFWGTGDQISRFANVDHGRNYFEIRVFRQNFRVSQVDSPKSMGCCIASRSVNKDDINRF